MDKCNVKTLLRENKLKITNQRERLLQKIIEIDTLFSADSLYKEINDHIDLVTVYRILNIFVKKNIIREALIIDKTQYYELSCAHHPIHPHFICKKCGNLYCLNKIDSNYFDNIVNKYSQYTIENINIQFTGVCSNCK